MSWMPLYVNDWLGSKTTLTMTNEQRGAYITLLIWQWQSDNNAFEDVEEMSLLCGLDLTDANHAKLLDKFTQEDGWYNAKSREVWLTQGAKFAKMVEGGRKGGLKGGFKGGFKGGVKQPDPDPEPSNIIDTERSNTCLGQFDVFWKAYPRKIGKTAAEKAWAKHKPDLDMCIKVLGWQKQDKQWQDKAYIPHPATWLNRGSWNDENTGGKSQEELDLIKRRMEI